MSGIFIRIGARTVDIADTSVVEFKAWWDTLDETARFRLVRHLLIVIAQSKVEELQERRTWCFHLKWPKMVALTGIK